MNRRPETEVRSQETVRPKIRCLIVDDEPHAHEVLRVHMATVPSLEWVGSCYNAVDAMEVLSQKPVDLLFLDIQMPTLLGTELVKVLAHPPKIIFVTAMRDYAMEGFDLGVVDYLLKPVSLERFLKAVNKVNNNPIGELNNSSEVRKFLYFRADRKMVKVWLHDILYVESLKDYLKIVTEQGTLITKLTLAGVSDMLPSEEFFQVHRSFIVSKGKINAYSSDSIMVGKAELPVGPLYKNQIKEKMEAVRWP
jgi:DNA-binding LytR/AlgR family response regulator